MDTERLGKFILLLGSDQDGEVVAAARMIVKTLKKDGKDLHSLVESIKYAGLGGEKARTYNYEREHTAAGGGTAGAGRKRWNDDDLYRAQSRWDRERDAFYKAAGAYREANSRRAHEAYDKAEKAKREAQYDADGAAFGYARGDYFDSNLIQTLAYMRSIKDELPERERDFIDSLHQRRVVDDRLLTEKQIDWLQALWQRERHRWSK